MKNFSLKVMLLGDFNESDLECFNSSECDLYNIIGTNIYSARLGGIDCKTVYQAWHFNHSLYKDSPISQVGKAFFKGADACILKFSEDNKRNWELVDVLEDFGGDNMCVYVLPEGKSMEELLKKVDEELITLKANIQ